MVSLIGGSYRPRLPFIHDSSLESTAVNVVFSYVRQHAITKSTRKYMKPHSPKVLCKQDVVMLTLVGIGNAIHDFVRGGSRRTNGWPTIRK